MLAACLDAQDTWEEQVAGGSPDVSFYLQGFVCGSFRSFRLCKPLLTDARIALCLKEASEGARGYASPCAA